MNTLTDCEIKKIQQILENGEHVAFHVTCSYHHTFWFTNDENEAECRISCSRDRLTVSRINLLNRRQGTMTQLYKIFKSICRSHNWHMIVIQSVLTSCMSAWCYKNEFKPDEMASYETDEGIRGDYYISL